MFNLADSGPVSASRFEAGIFRDFASSSQSGDLWQGRFRNLIPSHCFNSGAGPEALQFFAVLHIDNGNRSVAVVAHNQRSIVRRETPFPWEPC